MRKAKLLVCVVVIAGHWLIWPVPFVASLSIPDEPSEECLVEQTYDTSVGLLFRSYSLQGDGYVDYRTARHILGITYDDPTNEALEVSPYPVMYWYDPNRDGQWKAWVDRDEQGTPANAMPYDWRPGDVADQIISAM
jgi:hypothetical protein